MSIVESEQEIAGYEKELGIIIHLVSHLATPDGKPHEEGGRVMIRHFKGSRAIGFWCHFMFGMERNQQAEDMEERHTTTFRVLKDRLTGQSVGQCVYFEYDQETARLFETEPTFLPGTPTPLFDGPYEWAPFMAGDQTMMYRPTVSAS